MNISNIINSITGLNTAYFDQLIFNPIKKLNNGISYGEDHVRSNETFVTFKENFTIYTRDDIIMYINIDYIQILYANEQITLPLNNTLKHQIGTYKIKYRDNRIIITKQRFRNVIKVHSKIRYYNIMNGYTYIYDLFSHNHTIITPTFEHSQIKIDEYIKDKISVKNTQNVKMILQYVNKSLNFVFISDSRYFEQFNVFIYVNHNKISKLDIVYSSDTNITTQKVTDLTYINSLQDIYNIFTAHRE